MILLTRLASQLLPAVTILQRLKSRFLVIGLQDFHTEHTLQYRQMFQDIMDGQTPDGLVSLNQRFMQTM